MDVRLRRSFATAVGRRVDGLALVAVGGYGRAELSPASDVDVVLVHDPGVPAARVSEVAESLWYPLWDDSVPLDHAVRDAEAMVATAATDLRAALGMLDARHVAGSSRLSADVRTRALAGWRRDAARRLAELRRACSERAERFGDVAHSAVPDLKESSGGLRDGVVLRALVATWLVDVPRREAETHRATLLAARDVLHEVSGRRGDRLVPDLVPEVAVRLGLDPHQLTVAVRDAGRRTAHLLHSAWVRLESVTTASTTPSPTYARRPDVQPLRPGVGRAGGSLVLTAGARPSTDDLLTLRAATLAAEEGLLLNRASAQRLAASAVPLPTPWPLPARRLLVRLLAAGPGLVPVWEELDQVGVVDGWLPEWEHVRLRSSDAAVHRWTIDRHSVQTAANAAGVMRRVPRPDLLVVAALLHDIGKGREDDHSVLGARMAREICVRWGFDDGDAERVSLLVRHHLLLPLVATRRDLDDPATVGLVTSQLPDPDILDLLLALTECDARATGSAAWTSWRAGLVRRLAAMAREQLAGHTVSGPPPIEPAPVAAPLGDATLRIDTVEAADRREDTRLQVQVRDRTGVLAQVAAGLALAGLPVRAARAWTTDDGTAVSMWDVPEPAVDTALVADRLHRVLDGTVDVRQRLGSQASSGEPTVVGVVADASSSATVLEVRAGDRRGLVWALCDVFARHDVDVRSAHLDTLGPQAHDVFYLVGPSGRPLRRDAVHAVVADLRRI